MKALVKSKAGARTLAGRDSRAGDRHQRRADSRALHGHLRHRCAHLRVGRLGAEDHSCADDHRPRICWQDRRRRIQCQRLLSRRHRERRGARGLRALPQLPGRQAASLRFCQGRRRQSAGGLCRIDFAPDDQYLEAQSRHQPGSCGHLRSIWQRCAYRAFVSCAGRGCADHRRRPDRHHGHPRGAARRGAACRGHRPQSLPAGAGAQDGRNAWR